MGALQIYIDDDDDDIYNDIIFVMSLVKLSPRFSVVTL